MDYTKFDPTINSDYLNGAFSPKILPAIVSETTQFLRKMKKLQLGFDAIVVRGVSGMLVGSPVAYRMKMPLVVVRKDDGNHSCRPVEGYSYVNRYVVIDDFVCTGDTIREIRTKMTNYNGAAMVGFVSYTAIRPTEYYQKKYQKLADEWNCWIKMVHAGKIFLKPQIKKECVSHTDGNAV